VREGVMGTVVNGLNRCRGGDFVCVCAVGNFMLWWLIGTCCVKRTAGVSV
jgi:hypothetical protein